MEIILTDVDSCLMCLSNGRLTVIVNVGYLVYYDVKLFPSYSTHKTTWICLLLDLQRLLYLEFLLLKIFG